MKELGQYKDEVIGSNYTLQILPSAQALSKKLKDTYKSIGIDFASFNTDSHGFDVKEAPPAEIYEYQNFFLLEKADGKTVLLDGFRRLLWYNAPDKPILVRTYKQAELSESQILSLLVNLNHFKFFSDSSYQERGFGLLLKTVFDIDITKFRKTFDAYLSSSTLKNSYMVNYDRVGGTEKIETIKERLLNPQFVGDMNFISRLKQEGCMVNSFLGALVYKKRQELVDKPMDADKFLSLHKTDKVLSDLLEKFKKVGTNNSAKSQEAVNRIMEMYTNIFTLMEGGSVEKSYAEKLQECKDLREVLNKDKNWTKLTGSKSCYLIERVMKKAPKDLEFKCLVYPKEESVYSFNNRPIVPLKYGVNDYVKYVKTKQESFGNTSLVFGFTDPEVGSSWLVRHNYSGYGNSGKKYTTVDYQYDKEVSKKFNHDGCGVNYDIELWVKLKKEEWSDKK